LIGQGVEWRVDHMEKKRDLFLVFDLP
jgi:hypothetical protein